MAWDKDWLVPSVDELDRPDREVNRLVTFLESRGSPALSAWAVQTLADELGVPVAATRRDPIGRTADLGDAWLTSLQSAGRDAGKRRELGRLARRQIREWIDIARMWQDDPE